MSNQEIQHGLKENWKQFTLLVIVNLFVGSMVGMERSIFPQFAQISFGIASKTAILTFIIAFGIAKAIANYYTGKLTNKYGSRRLLIIGWLFALPIPLLLIYAQSWGWVVFANVLLGINQGLTWSSTVMMKIDLVGPKNRGLAMGINEFSGYFAVGIVAFLSGYIANTYGITPYPFFIGYIVSVAGLCCTLFWVKDTRHFVNKEASTSSINKQDHVFWETTIKNKTLSAVTQAGLVNNLNDGMIWGLLPILILSYGYNTQYIGIIVAVYPTVWGIGQLFTGRLSDFYSKKNLLFLGMLLEGIAILLFPSTSEMYPLIAFASILGVGTALVYPTFAATIAEITHPNQRAESIGVFRLWRDSGYAIGAVISGISADIFGIETTFFVIGGITLFSSLIIQIRMPKQIKAN